MYDIETQKLTINKKILMHINVSLLTASKSD